MNIEELENEINTSGITVFLNKMLKDALDELKEANSKQQQLEELKLRDHFASLILRGSLSHQTSSLNMDDSTRELIAEKCYELADAMIEARNKKNN